MLMCRSMINNDGTICTNNFEHALLIFNIANNRDDVDVSFPKSFSKLHINCVNTIFTMPDKDNFPRFKFHELTAQFRTDRTTSSLYHDGMPGHLTLNCANIQFDELAPKKIFHFNTFQLANCYFSSH